jgi:hypothetical protein
MKDWADYVLVAIVMFWLLMLVVFLATEPPSFSSGSEAAVLPLFA